MRGFPSGATFDYDAFDNLIKAEYHQSGNVESIYRAPDAIGNLFESPRRDDRRYGAGGRLLEDPNFYFHYDCEGNLVFKEFKKPHGYSSLGRETIEKKYGIKFKATATGWLYEWSGNGMLERVINPQQGKIRFGYDPLGRRVWKEVKNTRTCWLWDGNVPLHEWTETKDEPKIDIITWVFEEGSFVPCARLTENGSQSIVTDYLGTPSQMYDAEGNKTWHAELDIYGRIRTFAGSSLRDCPFRYQGQYEDAETGLYYNRFRYYDPSVGNYLSQDPIRLLGGNNLYGYVPDTNTWIDIWGLAAIKNKVDGDARETIALEHLKKEHPNATILKERYIRDVDGKSVKDIDVEGGSRRRVDFVVVEDGKVVGVYEVTSPTAKKTAQIEKERIIRAKAKGGAHVKAPGRNGKRYNISNIETTRLDVDLKTKKVKCH